jgi:hypothetical protein
MHTIETAVKSDYLIPCVLFIHNNSDPLSQLSAGGKI